MVIKTHHAVAFQRTSVCINDGQEKIHYLYKDGDENICPSRSLLQAL